jgi:hypothetical protein
LPDTSRNDLPWGHHSPETPFWQLPEPVRRLVRPDYDQIPTDREVPIWV